MKYQIAIIVFLFIVLDAFSQKQIHKVVDATKLSTLVIYGNSISSIKLTSSEVTEIDMLLKVEGSNSEQIVLKAQQFNDTLFVTSSYQPLFTPPDDKLNAHKQISIELTILLPNNRNLNLTSDIASVFLSGNYNDVLVELLNGSFKTNANHNNLLVNTLHGNINIETTAAELNVYSKNGKLFQESIDFGKSKITANSINGNISIIKTR